MDFLSSSCTQKHTNWVPPLLPMWRVSPVVYIIMHERIRDAMHYTYVGKYPTLNLLVFFLNYCQHFRFCKHCVPMEH